MIVRFWVIPLIKVSTSTQTLIESMFAIFIRQKIIAQNLEKQVLIMKVFN